MVKKAAIIGVPLDLGANRRGVDMGPSAIRVTDILKRIESIGYTVLDNGDVDTPIPEECKPGDHTKKYAREIRDVCERLCTVVYEAMRDSYIPIVLGGDHSIAIGSIAGLCKFHRENNQKIGLIWLDAHGDMNVPWSTNSGNVHGMPLSHVLGIGDAELNSIGGVNPKVSSNNCCLIGVRDLDEREKSLVADSGVHVFSMKEIDRYGVSKVIEDAIKFASKDTTGIHVSLDLDVLDPAIAPGVGTPKRGGLNYREAHLCMELIADSGLMTSVDVVELNPILDVHNSTAELATELILSALGKRIF